MELMKNYYFESYIKCNIRYNFLQKTSVEKNYIF